MKLHPGMVVALVLGLGAISSAEALAPQPGIAGCLDRAQARVEAEHQACIDAGRNQMVSACSAAASAALSACLSLKHPLGCIGANVVGVSVCIAAFYTAWEEAQSCMQAADARFHETEANCYETFGSSHHDPMPVRQCPGYQEAEQSHIPE